MATNNQKIIVQTGNIIDMEDQIRLVGQSTADELKGCVKTALNQWNRDSSSDLISSDEYLKNEDDDGEDAGEHNINTVIVKGTRKPLIYSDAKGINTTAKIFLSDNSGKYAMDAIKTVLKNINRDCIESVIISPPDVSDDVSLSDVIDTWRMLETAVDQGIVARLGIADINSRLFKDIYHWAKVKPSTIQVNLSNCCSVSEELTEFARDNDVQVLTHSDDAEMLDEETVSSILSRVGAPEADCQVQWVARHRTIHVCFGLVLDKGYTLAIDCKRN